jgi:CheY-like chemotaxis protein
MNDIQTTVLRVDDPADYPTTVLLIEDDPADARLIRDALAGTGSSAFRVEWVMRLSDALKRPGIGISVFRMTASTSAR